MKYLFCNTGWMEAYEGNRKSDQISGGGSFVAEEGTGHEVCNFHSYKNHVYGYVQPSRGKRSASAGSIRLESIVNGDVTASDQAVENVFVIWTATRPEGGSVVVGWYKNATIFREYQYFKSVPSLHKRNGLEGYRIQAKSADAKLLPIDERSIQVPRKTKGGMGQSNVWYGDSQLGEAVALEVAALARGEVIKRKFKPRSTDPEHNSKVEKSAVNTAWKYYESLGYSLISVEKDNVGWDLEATLNRTKLKIEVKGLSGTNPLVELSPNEYTAFSEKRHSYRLAVVTEALSNPELHICSYSNETETWQVITEDGGNVDIDEKIGARIKLRI